MYAFSRPQVARLPQATRRALSVVSLLAATVLAACDAEGGVPFEELVRDGERFLTPETLEPYTGIAFATFQGQPGVVQRRSRLRNGAYDGPFEAFFVNQKLSSKEVYDDGVLNGPYEWYFESGALFEEGTYKNGLLEGPYRAYWENGDLYEEGSYRAGQFDGPRRWFTDNRMIEMVTYRDGVIEGLYERYLEDGTLDLKGMLFQGEPCGTWIEGPAEIHYPACGIRVTE